MLLGAALAAAPSAPHAAVSTQPTLTLDGAQRVVTAITDRAAALHTTGAIAVVDAGGSLVALERLDGTFPAASEISLGKARTAALFRKPTRAFEDLISKGRTPMIALHDDRRDFTPLMGGVPIEVDGAIVGAVGVSGAASAQQDDELATFGAMALGASMTSSVTPSESLTVTHIAAAEVQSAFQQGRPLLENGSFKIHASRRERAGMAEVHAHETDVIYVLEGGAEFVTGGVLVDGQPIASDEIRGPAIDGGESRRLAKGDVITVPAGVPHWFRAIDEGTPLLYYVVKVVD